MGNAVQKVDVGILAFSEDEFAAIKASFPQEGLVDGRRRYSLSRVPLQGGEAYQVAVTRVVQTTGKDDAGEAVRILIEDVAPSLVLLVGFAATMPSDHVTLGDVVVATRAVHANGQSLALKGQYERMHDDVARWASDLSGLSSWYGKECTGAPPHLPAKPEITFRERAVMASLKYHFSDPWPVMRSRKRAPRPIPGVAVVKDKSRNFHELSTSSFRADEVLALETGTWTAYGAARDLNVPLMSIRGIAEVVGLEPDSKWLEYACKAAACFALAFLKTRPLEPHRPAPHDIRINEPPPDRPINLASTFGISRLALFDVGGFAERDLTFIAPHSQEKGQWVILLGDNGMGKTTILRALTLALAPAGVIPVVLGRTGSLSPAVRTGADIATIRLGMPGEDEVTVLSIEPVKGGERLKKRGYAPVPMPFLVAYGSRRGSGLAGSTGAAEFTSTAAVETLFDEGANLIRPDEWLKGWKLAALQNPKSQDARFFRAACTTLCTLLPGVEQIHVTREAVEVEGPTIGRIPLGALSDGYRTTMGWILDMIARWVEEAKRQNIPVDEHFHKQMTGFAIIDEIDLHLHPVWQRDVISMLRDHFPRMSFVVTTHNPLTLLGAQPGEIYVLRRNDQGEVDILQRDLPPGAGAEQILTGDWFGLHSTLSDAMLDKLAEHYRLINEKGLHARETVKAEEELRRELGSYADTSIERLAHEAAAKVIDGNVRSLTPDQRREAQEKIAEILRESTSTQPAPEPAKSRPAVPKPKSKARRARRSTD